MNKLTRLLFSATSKDSLILLSGTVVSNLINFLIVFILARSLPVSQLGLIFTGLVFLQLVTDLFELGINSTILAKIPVQERLEQIKVISSSLILKLGVGLIVGLVIYFLADSIAELIFKTPNIKLIIQMSALGVLFLMIIFWSQSVLQARKDFLNSMLVNTSINLFRLVGVLLISFLGLVNLINIYLSLQLVLVFSLIFVLVKLYSLINFSKFNWLEMKKLLWFGWPIGLGFAMAALYTKLDQILILRLAGETEAGIYGLAQRLSAFFIFAVASFNSAIVPRIVSVDQANFKKYFKKVMNASYGLAILTLVGGVFIAIFIPIVFGPNFNSSIIPFLLLTLGMALFIVSTPFSSLILYRFKKNYYSFYLSGFSLILVFGLLSVLVPIYSSVGAAISILIVYLVQLVVNFSYYQYLKKDS